MPKFIELMTTGNEIEIRNVSMFVMKSCEIRKKTEPIMPLMPSCI